MPACISGLKSAGVKWVAGYRNNPARESITEKTITMNLGLALDDIVTAVKIYHTALEKGIGTDLPL